MGRTKHWFTIGTSQYAWHGQLGLVLETTRKRKADLYGLLLVF